jgi:hypothetical protein
MTRPLAIICTLILCAFNTNQQPNFKPFHTLTGGTWLMNSKKGLIFERWIKINDKELRGQDFEVKGKDTVLQEQVQLIQKDNKIFYIPTVKNVNGAKPVPFEMIESKNNKFVFSNPQHDFPQRIIYEFVATDSLHAWIEGRNNGSALKIDYYYKRIK